LHTLFTSVCERAGGEGDLEAGGGKAEGRRLVESEYMRGAGGADGGGRSVVVVPGEEAVALPDRGSGDLVDRGWLRSIHFLLKQKISLHLHPSTDPILTEWRVGTLGR